MSSLQIRDAIKGSIAIGKGEQGPVGPVGPQGPIGDNNVCIGLSPTNEAEIWFDTTDGDNTKEVATKEYIDSEIAKIDSSNFATKTATLNPKHSTLNLPCHCQGVYANHYMATTTDNQRKSYIKAHFFQGVSPTPGRKHEETQLTLRLFPHIAII